jgi:hypothetical protein
MHRLVIHRSRPKSHDFIVTAPGFALPPHWTPFYSGVLTVIAHMDGGPHISGILRYESDRLASQLQARKYLYWNATVKIAGVSRMADGAGGVIDVLSGSGDLVGDGALL